MLQEILLTWIVVARGLHGVVGNSISRIGLLCHTGGTTPIPVSLPLATNIVAVNLVNPQTGPSTTQPTPYVQIQWTDQATIETGYQVFIDRRYGGMQRIVFNHPAALGSGSRQVLTIADLPGGEYRASVCTAAISTVSQAMNCPWGSEFTIAAGSNPSTCNPVITAAERVGVATGRLRWAHSCSNPNNFSVKLRCGSSPFGTVATAFNGSDRQATFPLGVGSGVIQVCANYVGQLERCSATLPIQCN